VLYPDHANTPRDLLRLGDEAMYRAKESGRNAIEIFAPVAVASSSQISLV
jgi:GGDEF domain-containing protein